MESSFDVLALELPGCYLIKSQSASDVRGDFVKFFHAPFFSKANIELDFKELFYTVSKKGVIRGIHFQEPHYQGKLVHCLSGKVIDMIVDLRAASPTYKQYKFVELNGCCPSSIYIPAGIGHAYLVVEDSIVCYCCTEVYYPSDDTGIIWNDHTLNIHWPLDAIGGADKIIVSEKDKSLPDFISWQNNKG